MSKSSTATLPKIPTQLSSKSAWAKGPPPNTANSQSRSQSPVPSTPVHQTHSRRPSTLSGQAVPIKDGVSIPRNNVGSVKQGSAAVTFGSIDDAAAAPISSSPAPTPAIKSAESVKSFGTVPATTASSSQINGKPSLSKPPSTTPQPSHKGPKVDIRALFRGSGAPPSTPSQPSSDTSSPSTRPSSLPQQQQSSSQHTSTPSGSSTSSFSNFVPQNSGIRNQQQNSGPSGAGPRSPVYQRGPQNGTGPRPPGGTNGPGGPPQMSPGLSNNRGPPPNHPQQQPGMPPQQMPPMQPMGWPSYYYPVPPEQYMGYQPGWYVPQQSPLPQPQHGLPPPGPHGPPHPGMPMSPRNAPPPLQQPGTPTPAPAMPSASAPPPSATHHSSASISSPPPTPSSLKTTAPPFVPGGRSAKVTLKNPDGIEVKLDNLRGTGKHSSPGSISSPPTAPATPLGSASPGKRATAPIRIETEEDRKKRLALEEEKERKVKEEKARKEREAKEKKEAEERKKREEEEAKKRAEEEKVKKAEEEKKRKQEEEEKARQEEERKKEAEALEKERSKKEEEKAAKLKAEAEEAEKKKKAEEEAIAKAKAEAEEIAKASTTTTKPEEGEIVEGKPEGDATPVEKPQEKENKPLRIDTAPEVPRRRPGPLDLSGASRPNIPQPLPSALATARVIEDLNRVPYPEGVQSPKIELNVNATGGKFRYDREFLLQFMKICTEKPDMLPPLDAIGLEPTDPASFALSRGGSGRHRTSSAAGAPSRQASLSSFNPSGSSFKGGAAGFAMGQFGTGGKMTSDERFQMANTGRPVSTSGSFPRPAQMTRTASQGGPGAPSTRTRSKRGTQRSDANKIQSSNNQQGHGSGYGGGGGGGHGGGYNNSQNFSLEPVAPLQATANRWDRKTLGAVDPNSPELVDRKVKGLLNKLTMEKFDSISDQIISWANKSEAEKDGRTLIQVIKLVFEKATDEAGFSEMYARLCRKMMEQISPKVQDDGIRNPENKPIAGGQLFRKYLLNRCQEDFERGWAAKELSAAAAKEKQMDDEKTAEDNKKNGENKEGDGEAALYSDEYYAAAKAKRRGLGLIRFIGELFKLQMLTERIMHECVKKLLGNVENPEEEEIESLCKLLTTVGHLLDTSKARAHMDVYFSRMKELTKSQNVTSRMQFMLQDVLELRDRKWVSRTLVAVPTTIAQIHEAAAKEKAVHEKEQYQRTLSMSRGGSRRGGDRNNAEGQVGPDGWSVAPSRPPPKAGDLSKFGQIGNKPGPATFGPGGVFAAKEKNKEKRESVSRTASSSNMFSMLSQNPEAVDAAAPSKTSRPPSRKASMDLGSGVPEPVPQRKRLMLKPRSVPLEEPAAAGEADVASEEDDAAPEMSEAEAKKKIDEDIKEFFSVRNLEEAEAYFSALSSSHHHLLVDKLVSFAVESKEADARLVSDLFALATSKELCSTDAFEQGFANIVEFLDDIAIDAPKAPNLLALMMKGPGFDEDRRTRLAGKSAESGDKLLELIASS